MVTSVTSQEKEESEVGVKARVCTEQQPLRHPPASWVRDCLVQGTRGTAAAEMDLPEEHTNTQPSVQSHCLPGRDTGSPGIEQITGNANQVHLGKYIKELLLLKVTGCSLLTHCTWAPLLPGSKGRG